MHQEKIKQLLGEKSAALVEEGMLVGLGTGSTAKCFIESLIHRCKDGLKITAVSSSLESAAQARRGGIHVLEMNDVTSIDFTVDGADEVDPLKRMIKGGGGAHVREKILASTSLKWLVIVDESKLVKTLGRFGVPVEILPFGYNATIAKIEKLGYGGSLRTKKDASLYITDNGNYIFDIHHPASFPNPEEDEARLNALPGLVETGFFVGFDASVLVGCADGKMEYLR